MRVKVDVLEDGQSQRATSRGLVGVEVIFDGPFVVSTRGSLVLRLELDALYLPRKLLGELESEKDPLKVLVLRFLQGSLPECAGEPTTGEVVDVAAFKEIEQVLELDALVYDTFDVVDISIEACVFPGDLHEASHDPRHLQVCSSDGVDANHVLVKPIVNFVVYGILENPEQKLDVAFWPLKHLAVELSHLAW